MENKKNKKADVSSEAIFWFYKILLAIVVVTAIAVTVAAHYSVNYDARATESSLLAREIMQRITKDNIVDINSFDLELSKEYYVELLLNNSKQEKLEKGTKELLIFCDKGVFCKKYFYSVLTKEGNAKLEMFLAIRKTEKNE